MKIFITFLTKAQKSDHAPCLNRKYAGNIPNKTKTTTNGSQTRTKTQDPSIPMLEIGVTKSYWKAIPNTNSE